MAQQVPQTTVANITNLETEMDGNISSILNRNEVMKSPRGQTNLVTSALSEEKSNSEIYEAKSI